MDSTPSHFWAQLTAALGPVTPRTRLGRPRRLESDPLAHDARAWSSGSATAACDWIVIDGLDTVTHAACLPALAYLIANLPPQTRMIVTTHDVASARSRRPRRPPPDDHRSRAAAGRLPTRPRSSRSRRCRASTSTASRRSRRPPAAGWRRIRAAARYAEQHPAARRLLAHVRRAQAHCSARGSTGCPPIGWQFLLDTLVLDWLAGPAVRQHPRDLRQPRGAGGTRGAGSYLTSCLPPSASADPSLRWWRRHPLVTAALTQARPLVDQSDRNLRAASWFMEHGSFEPAMRHLMAAGRLEEAGRYLSAHENALFEEGRGQTARRVVREPAARLLGPARLAPGADGLGPGHLAGSPRRRDDARAAARPPGRLPRRGHRAARPPGRDGDPDGLPRLDVGRHHAAIGSARRAIDLFCEESPDNSQQVAPTVLVRALLLGGRRRRAARRELTRIAFQPFPTGDPARVAPRAA